MTTTKNYDYGNGGVKLDDSAVLQLQGIVKDVLASDLSAPGAARPIYQFLLEQISTTSTEQTVGPDGVGYTTQVTAPKAGVSLPVYNWISAAVNINGAGSYAGALVSEYTSAVYQIRTGPWQGFVRDPHTSALCG